MSNAIPEIQETKCLLVFGYNAADSHPIVARHILKAKANGAKVIVCDPRMVETARIADQWLPLKNGSNMALVNAFANVLINEGLYNKAFVANYTEGFDTFKATVAKYTPEYVEGITGLKAADIRAAIRTYAASPASMILWGMGVTQYGQAVDVVKGLAGIALLTGNFGRRGTGCGPVRGQNNVQGTCDMGMLPHQFPGLSVGERPCHQRQVCQGVGRGIPLPETGLPPNRAWPQGGGGQVQGLLHLWGRSGPDRGRSRSVPPYPGGMDLVIVQDIFMTQTAEMADVILPATSWGEHEGVYSSADRGFQRFYKAVTPPDNVKPDWAIFSLMATAMGIPWSTTTPKRSGTRCVRSARSTPGSAMTRWRISSVCSGPARPRITRAPAPFSRGMCSAPRVAKVS